MASLANTMSASPPDESSGAPQKRKSDEGAPQARAKRNRYISIAWYVGRAWCYGGSRTNGYASNECKRRKIKCNGYLFPRPLFPPS